MQKRVFTGLNFLKTNFKIELLLPGTDSREVLGIVLEWRIGSVVSGDSIVKFGIFDCWESLTLFQERNNFRWWGKLLTKLHNYFLELGSFFGWIPKHSGSISPTLMGIIWYISYMALPYLSSELFITCSSSFVCDRHIQNHVWILR